MTNDKDNAVLADRVERVTKWLDGGCSTWGTPAQDIREIIEALRQLTQSDAPKPDPLVEVLGDLEWNNNSPECASNFRAALDARGLEIRSKNDG